MHYIQYNKNISIAHTGQLRCGSCWVGRGSYRLWVVREVRCVFSQYLNVLIVLDSLIAVGNFFQMAGVKKIKNVY